MTYESGPGITSNDKGRAEAHGFTLSGDEVSGYRARLTLGLTAEEALYGCVEVLFAQSLPDLLAQCQAQKIIRSMVGQAKEAAS